MKVGFVSTPFFMIVYIDVVFFTTYAGGKTRVDTYPTLLPTTFCCKTYCEWARDWTLKMMRDGIGIGIGTKAICVEAICISNTTCNGVESTWTSCVGGMTIPFATHYRLPQHELVWVAPMCHHPLYLNHLLFVRNQPTTIPYFSSVGWKVSR